MKIRKIPEDLDSIYNPKQITKKEAREGLEKSIDKMREIIQKVKYSNKNQRVKHWAGGWFNAQEWYHSAEMHIKQHFRQKRRIDRAISV